MKAYLTIDDGPSEHTNKKLEHLKEKNIRAIWFCRGELLERYPDQAIKIIETGHIIGNHSWDHPRFSKITLEKCYSQVDRTEKLIENLYSNLKISQQKKLFRFPYGDKGGGYKIVNAKLEKIIRLQEFLNKRGYSNIQFKDITLDWYSEKHLQDYKDIWWTFDPLEWKLLREKPSGTLKNLDDIINRMECELQGINSSQIIVMHDFNKTSYTFIPIIEKFEELGFIFSDPLPGMQK